MNSIEALAYAIRALSEDIPLDDLVTQVEQPAEIIQTLRDLQLALADMDGRPWPTHTQLAGTAGWR